jgi:hypothetical protein
MVIYFAKQFDPGSTQLARIIGTHAAMFFGIIAFFGCAFAIIAAKHAKFWIALVVLNGGTFILELCAS